MRTSVSAIEDHKQSDDVPEHGGDGDGEERPLEAARVREAWNAYQTPVDYPGTGLARKLRSVAQLISAGLNTRIYYVTLNGFDTHSNQRDAHAGLLAELSGAVAAFLEDVGEHGHTRPRQALNRQPQLELN